eukprot:3451741-Amphidinium_carterae.2
MLGCQHECEVAAVLGVSICVSVGSAPDPAVCGGGCCCVAHTHTHWEDQIRLLHVALEPQMLPTASR